MGSIIIALDDLYPEESFEAIKNAFENEEVDESLVCLDDIKATLKRTKEDVLNDVKEDHHSELICDSIDELYWWAAFNKHTVDYFPNELKEAAAPQDKKKKKAKAKMKAAKKQRKRNRK